MLLIVPADAPFVLDPIPGVDVLSYDPDADLSDEHLAADAAVIWGFASPIIDQLVPAPNLRWIQTLTAGPDFSILIRDAMASISRSAALTRPLAL